MEEKHGGGENHPDENNVCESTYDQGEPNGTIYDHFIPHDVMAPLNGVWIKRFLKRLAFLLVDSAREEIGEKASNMNASRTRFVIVEAMLTNPPPPFLERDDEERAAWCWRLPTTCLLL